MQWECAVRLIPTSRLVCTEERRHPALCDTLQDVWTAGSKGLDCQIKLLAIGGAVTGLAEGTHVANLSLTVRDLTGGVSALTGGRGIKWVGDGIEGEALDGERALAWYVCA